MLTIHYGDGAIPLPEKCLACNAGLMELRVLLLLSGDRALREGYPENAEKIALAAGCETGAVHSAVAFWRGAGILEASGVPDEAVPAHTVKADKAMIRDKVPDYTGEELKNLVEKSDGSLKDLIDACQEILGKMFNQTEIGNIVALSDYLRLEKEYILLLVQYCAGQGKNSVAYVSKMAYGLFNDGIDNYPKLEAYIRYKEKYDSTVWELRKTFGIGDRALTKKENGIIKGWIEELCLPLDVITAAYDTTVDTIKKLSFEYMDKVLRTWSEAGVKTAEDAERLKAEWKKQKTEEASGKASFETDEFFEAALKRSMEALNTGDKK